MDIAQAIILPEVRSGLSGRKETLEFYFKAPQPFRDFGQVYRV